MWCRPRSQLGGWKLPIPFLTNRYLMGGMLIPVASICYLVLSKAASFTCSVYRAELPSHHSASLAGRKVDVKCMGGSKTDQETGIPEPMRS